MKIESFEIVQIALPLEAPIRWAFGLRTHVTRNILRLRLANGVEGVAETVGGDTVKGILQGVCRTAIGESPFAVERLTNKLKMHSYFAGYAGLAAVSGLEMACWDAMGKLTARPVYDLMGGLWEPDVEFSGYLFYRYVDPGTGRGGETTPDEIVAEAQDLAVKHGFTAFNLKGGLFPPEAELGALTALRDRFGPSVRLRIDPQGNWSYPTALASVRRLQKIGVEFVEDPVWGMDAMARLRKEVALPFATNMWVCDAETLQAAIRLMPADIVLADPHRWGGLLACKKLAAVAETLGLSLSLHSAAELGISTAACLHLAASTPCMRMALHTHYPHQLDDVITTPFEFRAGRLVVPSGPGLGVALDEAKLARYAEVYREQAATGVPAHVKDPFRPDFVPRAY